MHVKLNVIKLFNRLSLLADIQNQPAVPPSNENNQIYNTKNIDGDSNDSRTSDDGINLATDKSSNYHRKLIISSSLQLHEDDLSRIDVKSLVS